MCSGVRAQPSFSAGLFEQKLQGPWRKGAAADDDRVQLPVSNDS